MENDSPRLEDIERYLLGEMPSEEHRDFEQQRSQDPQLDREVREQENLYAGIRQMEEDNFRQRLNSLGKNAEAPQKSKKVWIWGIAASLLLLLIPLSVIMMNAGGEDDLFGKYFSAYPNVVTARAQGDLLGQALAHYELAEYEQAAPLLQQVLQEDPKQADALFYLAMCELANETPQKAASRFQALSNSPSDYQAASQWFLALAYLKQQKTELLKRQLDLVIDSGSSFSDQARSLRDELP